MEEALRSSGIPLFSLETRTPLSTFDIVGFSLQYELSFTNVLMMLDLAGIPLRAESRGERCPLVVAGGPVVFSPEPVAEFFDLFLIGDGEEAFPSLLETYVELRERSGVAERWRRPAGPGPEEAASRAARVEILKELAKLPGVYVPSLYRLERDQPSGLRYVAGPDPSKLADGEEPPPFPIRRAVLEDINKYPFPVDTVVPHSDIVHDRVSIEIARGCTEGCRFCQAGTIYRPVRERTAESIIDTALDALESTGYDELSITSLSPADYSCLPDLVGKVMDRLAESRVALSVSSLRPYGLTEDLANQISRVKRSGFTIAPEAGTQRLRDVLNKGITEEHILQAAHNAFGAGWDLIKTYFMIGLPTETEEDLLAMLDLCEKIHAIGRRKLSKKNGGPGGAPKINFSASSHVPKPHAPFQWARMESVEALYGKQRFLASRLRNPHVKFKRHHVETSVLEAVMSRGDRALADVIETAYRKGCRFDGWTELFRWKEWCDAFDENEISMDPYLAEIPLESILPWDHIDTTVLKKFLEREWNRALEAKASPPCEKPYKKFNRPFRPDDKLVCYDCGCECDLPHITKERVENHERLLSIRSGRKPLAAAPAGAASARFRATFRKFGRARFISHLDLARAFARAFRRARVRLKYTQGFNPKPILAFTPALALGAEGLEEQVEFHLSGPGSESGLVEKLNTNLPEGVEVLTVSAAGPSAPGLTADARSARYRVRFPASPERSKIKPGHRGSGSVDAMPFNEESGLRSESGGPGAGSVAPREQRAAGDSISEPESGEPRDPSWHLARIETFNDAPSRAIDKVRKGRTVEVDLKKFVGEVSFRNATKEEVELGFTVAFENGATVRPEEVLIGIYGFVPRGCSIIRERIEFISTEHDPMTGPHAVSAAPAVG
jgi:radical SAM family uncharacterized protein